MTKTFVCLCLVVLSIVRVDAARAETDFEDRIRRRLQENPGYSLVFMHVRLIEEGSHAPNCQEILVTLLSDKGKTTTFTAQNSPSLFGHVSDSATYGGAVLLPPGTYAVRVVGCQQAAGIRLAGDFARFRIGADEIVNAGSLLIDFTRAPMQIFQKQTFTARTSVEDLSEKAKISLTERSPLTFPRAARRYMIPNPATSR